MERRVKIAWICHFSDSKTRSHIHFSKLYYRNVLNFVMGRKAYGCSDRAVWITNAIKEFERFNDIELTIIFPHVGIKGRIQQFVLNEIKYICFRSEDDNFISLLFDKITKRKRHNYPKNRLLIKNLIAQLNPDVIHIIGAENPYYSLSALDAPETTPVLVSLQTLMNDPDFFNNYPINKNEYRIRSAIERNVICRANYIASPIMRFHELIRKGIKDKAIFLKMTLAVGQDIDTTYKRKEFDFVYFSANLSKAGDYAIEAFAEVQRIRPEVTLNMSGAYSPELKKSFDKRIKDLGIEKKVYFTGSQPTHDAVLKQIRRSRFAVLPLKIDLISGTIREAMACGLPVVSTITPETPILNNKRESILLSEKGDFHAMANNMLRLIDDESFANKIRDNGLMTIQELYSNNSLMELWRKGYFEIIDNFHFDKPFSSDIIFADFK